MRRFSASGVASSTVYNVLNNFKARRHSRNMPKGRKASKMTTTKRRELIRRCKGKVGVSQRKLSKKYGISQSYVNKVLKEGGMTYRKRKKGPNPTESQKKAQKIRLRKMTRNIFKAQSATDIVMDDESYFTFSGAHMPENWQGIFWWRRGCCTL